ncbi:hypothetical protein JOD55_000054 [Arcanobacterium pluranimalium]|uniref:DUF3800 domain-containing protein n=1 Tax=Arcanobacterium pluranimalium TaxID=108028 RepID=UPI00195E7FBD|nr:hypothetical protein [Arcanobacterium pluranimalium]
MEYTLFVDESYNAGHYYIAGVLATASQLADLESRFLKIASYYQIVNNLPHLPEFHGHSIMTGRDDWVAVNGNFGSSITLLHRLTTAISQSGVEIFIEGVDTKRLNDRYKYPDPPHEICLRHLLERINEHLYHTSEVCKVIADTVPDEATYQQRIEYYCGALTLGYRSQKLLHIDPTINFVDSRNHFGVQSADIVAYLHRRLNENTSSSKSTKRACQRVYKPLQDNISKRLENGADKKLGSFS